MFRKSRNLNQTEAGTAVGVTFQQMQKYERGTNRVSASKLAMLADLFGVEVGDFFVGLKKDAPPTDIDTLYSRNETTKLVQNYYRLKSDKARQSVATLLEVLADELESEKADG